VSILNQPDELLNIHKNRCEIPPILAGQRRPGRLDAFLRWILIKWRKNARPAALFALTNPEHLGAASWAHALGCRPAVFHRYFLGVFHFSLSLAFYTIRFHGFSSSNFF
jgi:hypothetical protein